MASISTYLQKILDAVYGEEVRGSIHGALAAMNEESSSAMEYAATAKDSAAASAELAKNEAATATQKAGDAETAAAGALASETNAKASEETATQKAEDAENAAAGALASKTDAANSAATATQKAQEAATSEEAAAISAEEAEASKKAAAIIQSEIQTMEEQVAADKEAVETAKTGAEAARDAAAGSAATSSNNALTTLNAKEAAENAALSAAQDAEDAETAKIDAQASKAAAEAAEGNAKTSAESAAASAESARQYSGKPPKPQDGTWWIWNAETAQYEDTGIGCELVGPQGIGIQDIVLTSGDHSPGTSDVYTVTLTDGSTKTISVYNGRNGTGAGDVLGISFDLVLPVSGWSDGVLTISDNRLLAQAKYKYFLGADEASKEEFIDCGVQPKDITTDGVIVFTNKEDPTMDLTVNVIRFELGANGA